MVKVPHVLAASIASVAVAEDAAALLQTHAGERSGGRRLFDMVTTSGTNAICVEAFVGDIAPIAGTFTSKRRSQAVEVAAGSVAEENGSFCAPKQDVFLLQRTMGWATSDDMEASLGKKNKQKNDQTTTTTPDAAVNGKKQTVQDETVNKKKKALQCNVATMNFSNPSPECTAPVLARKRQSDEQDSFIPSLYSRAVSTPSTHNVTDLDLGSYTGDGKVLVYGTSKWLVETANGKFFNSGGHTSEFLLPVYHMGRAGFKFDFVTRDGGAVALEEWTYPLATGSNGFPAFENKLRETAAKYKDGLGNPKRTTDIPKDLTGYVGILIPGGHGPLVEEHLDVELGALLRKAHAMEMPIMSLCHGPTALRSAYVEGEEFVFKGYKMNMFPDSGDEWAASGVGYLPGYLKPNDQAERQLVELGMQVMNTAGDDSVYQDRELVSGASNQAAQKFSELALKALLAK